MAFFPLCRMDVEKVVNAQANQESKELAVLAVSLFFVCFSSIILVSAKVSKLIRAPCSEVRRASTGWIMILVTSTMIISVTLLSG